MYTCTCNMTLPERMVSYHFTFDANGVSQHERFALRSLTWATKEA